MVTNIAMLFQTFTRCFETALVETFYRTVLSSWDSRDQVFISRYTSPTHRFPFNTPTTVQFGGFHLRFSKFGESADDKLEDPQDGLDGYAFIDRHAPQIKKGNAHNKYMRLQLCASRSPIASWSRVDIKDAVAGLAAEELGGLSGFRGLEASDSRCGRLVC